MERFAEQIVLTCKECGEKLVVFGTLEEWRSRGAVLLCRADHKIALDEGDPKEEVLPSAS